MSDDGEFGGGGNPRPRLPGRGDFDHASMADAFRGPGMDTRTWLSYAIVDVPGEGEGESTTVEFDEDDGQLYVNVQLKPSDVPLRCRVGMLSAGSGETFYFPFCGGEEVLVAVPEGNLMGGGVVLCRFNNAYDGFPFDSVGGADPKTNSAAIWRVRTALTIESGASIQIRSAAAGAMLLLSAVGNVTLRDGKANVFQMSPDVFGYQNDAGDVVMQLDLNDQRYSLAIGQVTMTLTGKSSASNPQSLLQVPSTLAVGTVGLSVITAVEHVATTESIMNILGQLATLLVALPPGPPLNNTALGALLLAQIPLAITAASTAPQLPPIGAALAAAFLNPAMPSTKAIPASVAPGYQQFPGIGCAGFLAG